METGGARRLIRSSLVGLNTLAQRTDFFHGLIYLIRRDGTRELPEPTVVSQVLNQNGGRTHTAIERTATDIDLPTAASRSPVFADRHARAHGKVNTRQHPKELDRYNFAKFRDARAHAWGVIAREGGNVIPVSILSKRRPGLVQKHPTVSRTKFRPVWGRRHRRRDKGQVTSPRQFVLVQDVRGGRLRRARNGHSSPMGSAGRIPRCWFPSASNGPPPASSGSGPPNPSGSESLLLQPWWEPTRWLEPA